MTSTDPQPATALSDERLWYGHALIEFAAGPGDARGRVEQHTPPDGKDYCPVCDRHFPCFIAELALGIVAQSERADEAERQLATLEAALRRQASDCHRFHLHSDVWDPAGDAWLTCDDESCKRARAALGAAAQDGGREGE